MQCPDVPELKEAVEEGEGVTENAGPPAQTTGHTRCSCKPPRIADPGTYPVGRQRVGGVGRDVGQVARPQCDEGNVAIIWARKVLQQGAGRWRVGVRDGWWVDNGATRAVTAQTVC